MKIAVIGATGGTGKKVIERALEAGHDVIAVARRPEAVKGADRVVIRRGDVYDAASMVDALSGAEAVISCIGPPSSIAAGPAAKQGLLDNLRAGMQVMAANFSPGTVMSEGMSNVVAACQRTGVSRLVMQSGINLTDGKELSWGNRLAVGTMRRIFWRAIRDKAIAERSVMGSGLEWVIVRASVLQFAEGTLDYTAGPSARIAPLQALAFADCADCLVRAAASEPTWVRTIVNVGRR
ncbi:NAD(P)-dependent oxidoreductase [Paenibacillus sp. 598K]|uniref:NAD(P)-dependent oxidoreductase n=1 Tax=Paenibacillus sp. 598K TaxID=1117987 RepID=UPI000FFE98F5|nr:NAD(P)H-binding protein [Paenibacillus sp. 598K]